MKTKINEIFSSIQGEGPVVGYKQLFIRFCGCNLKCSYCDTDFADGTTYTPKELLEKITSEYDLKTFHSISLTGGEPLLSVEFLKEFLPLIKGQTKIYLETNATLAPNLAQIKDFIDIISADIKLGIDPKIHEKFFKECEGIETFAKIVFDETITQENIDSCVNLAKQYNIELVLQPKMGTDNKMTVSSDFCNEILEKFTEKYPNTRLIPQVHKFLDVR
ncbi:MAG: 7-carboxy-7-deazaguanine synthase QueE [Muribaculaceae bacterium]|nr:7-carboxy-7-deazaguanine synthase QueE [Muribaculaceae bacterium]